MMKARVSALILGVAILMSFLLVPAVFADGTGISITEVQTHFNFLDVGNATPQTYTLWAVVNNTGRDTSSGTGDNSLNFTNVTFILPFGVNPAAGVCNASNSIDFGRTNGTLNTTHHACTVGHWNLSIASEGTNTGVNVSITVTANMSALAMNHIARGVNTIPALIYAITNATNNSTTTLVSNRSNPVQHNSTSFWINPRPYAYAANVTANGTVYITNWNQTRNGYIMNAPLMTYNSTLGYPVPASNSFTEIMYMDRTPMEAASNSTDPLYMELFSYNLTFRVVVPYINNSTTDFVQQTYYINSPAAAGNQTLMPLLIRQQTVPGPMGQNMTMIMGLPAQSGFTVWYGVNGTAPVNSSNAGIYDDNNLTNLKGINLYFNPNYNANSPMLRIIATNITNLNNTDISILLTLMDFANQRTSSPVYALAQQISGFDMNAPPTLGENITTVYLVNISNGL